MDMKTAGSCLYKFFILQREDNVGARGEEEPRVRTDIVSSAGVESD